MTYKEKRDSFIKDREAFFMDIVQSISRPANQIEKMLDKEKFLVPIDENKTFLSAETGDLILSSKTEFYDIDVEVSYSFWQAADKLVFGINIKNEQLIGVLNSGNFVEIEGVNLFGLWGHIEIPDLEIEYGKFFYNWTFDVPDFYEKYERQEKFIVGIRQAHYKIMKILHIECFKLKNPITEEDSDSPLAVSNILNQLNSDAELNSDLEN